MLRLSPGATIGILGNGQLGRMLCLAAAPLGFRTHVFGPEKNSPAEQVATSSTVAAYDDETALAAFAKAVNIVTFEFENVPAGAASFLAARTTVRPSWRALEVAQLRTREKEFFAEIGARTPSWRPVNSCEELVAALAEIAPAAILKTSRLGYDGQRAGQNQDRGGSRNRLGRNYRRKARSTQQRLRCIRSLCGFQLRDIGYRRAGG